MVFGYSFCVFEFTGGNSFSLFKGKTVGSGLSCGGGERMNSSRIVVFNEISSSLYWDAFPYEVCTHCQP